MLSEPELILIKRGGWLWDHCWRFFSLIAGEPFLVSGCIIHFDGTQLYCNSYPISPGVEINSEQLISELAKRFKPALIWHSGPQPGPHHNLSDKLILQHHTLPSSEDICMEINVSEFCLENNPTRATWVRAGERRGMRWVAEESPVIGVSHLRLISEFVARINPGQVARSLISRVGDFARQKESYVVNVFRGEVLVAFCFVEGWFDLMDVSLFSFGDQAVPGVKDYLQWAVISHAKVRNKKTLNVGYSVNPGIKAFKEKWGASTLTTGYFDQLWHSYDSFDARYSYWPNRLLFG